MRLGLSSDAAPDASDVDLVEICLRRGLSSLEVTLDGGIDALAASALLARTGDAVRLAGLLVAAPAQPHALALLARRTGAPAVVAVPGDARARLALAQEIADADGAAMPLLCGAATEWVEPVAASGLPFGWQIDDSCDDPAADLDLILRTTGRVDYVRLVGGGPEAALQHGRGVGAVMRMLALAGYAGPVILTPSSKRYRLAWSAWLGRRGGWGCGSAAERASTIPITT